MADLKLKKKFSRIYIEISNICNLQCDFCPEVLRPKKVMSEELFRRALLQSSMFTDEVCLHLMGEPLAHPKFAKFIEMANEVGLRVMITTNGVLLGGERSEALLNPAVRQINFSVHSFDGNHKNKDIAPYLEKIFSFTKNAQIHRPDLYLNYRLWNLAGVASEQLKNQRIMELVNKEFGSQVISPTDIRLSKSLNVVGRLYLHFDTRFEWPSLNREESSRTGFCYGLQTHIGILADGTVVPCCLDKEAGVPLGNLQASTLAEILDGERSCSVSEGFRRRELREELCRRCTFIRRFDGKVKNANAPQGKLDEAQEVADPLDHGLIS